MDKTPLKPSPLTLNPNRTLFSVFGQKIRKCKDFICISIEHALYFLFPKKIV